MYKEDVLIIDRNVRTRAYEKYRTKEKRYSKSNWAKLKQSENILDAQKNLDERIYTEILCYMRLDVNYFRYLFTGIKNSGNAAFVLGSILLLTFFNMPIFVMYVFLGKYTKLSFIRVWSFIPIFKGVGYTVVMILLFNELFYVSSTSFILLLIRDIFKTKIPWEDCSFAEDNTFCISFNKSKRIKYKKGLCDTRYRISSVLFLEQLHKEEMKKSYYFVPQFSWIYMNLLIWILTMFISYQGFQRFGRFTTKLVYLYAILFSFLIFITMFHDTVGIHPDSCNPGFRAFLSINYWSNLWQQAMTYYLPGPPIFLGAVAPRNVSVSHITVYVFFIKCTVTLIVCLWTTNMLNAVVNEYQIANIHSCTQANGFQFIMAYIPDILARVPFSRILLFIWYTGILYFSFLSTLYNFTVIIETVIQDLPTKLKKYRFLICALFAATGFSVNIFYINGGGLNAGLIINSSITTTLLLTVFITMISIDFLYPIKRLCTDYHFSTGKPPSSFWTACWKSSPIFLLFGFLMLIVRNQTLDIWKSVTPVIKTLIYICNSCLISPVILMILWSLFKYFISQKQTPLISPEQTWGPYEAKQRIDRNKFYPNRDIKYRSKSVKCKHKCLVGTKAFADEVERQEEKYQNFIDMLSKTK